MTFFLNTRVFVSFLLGSIVVVLPVKTRASQTTQQQLIKVEKINFVGNTIYSDRELLEQIPKLNTPITLQKALSLRKIITDYYLKNGYIGSGAFIPLQKISAKKLTIRVVEGTLEQIELEGLNKLDEKYVLNRLPKTGTPLNIDRLVRSLGKLERSNQISKVEGRLTQASVGKNVLTLKVKEKFPFQTEFNLSNSYSPSVGELGGTIKANYHLLGFGDTLEVQYGLNEGLNRFGVGYDIPIDIDGGAVSLRYSSANTEAVEDPVSALDVRADFEAISLGMIKPILKLGDRSQLNFGLEFESIKSETFIDEDFSFAFVEGLEDGKNCINAIRLVQEFVSASNSSQIELSSQFNLGVNVLDTTVNELTGVDGLFWSWQGKAQWLKQFSSFKTLLKLDLQLSPDKLLPLEQILIGGYGSVRGYRQNLSVADNGVIGSFELMYPIGTSIGDIDLISFVDLGTVWNNSTPGFDREIASDFLASVGVGISYRLNKSIYARIDYGIPLVKLDNDNFTQAINFVFSVRP